ncbi:unnamed protein product [Closterium sp. Yama58-4]|nr:unnamed protein product [Closterium sp. Yama58-4]
MAAASSSPDSPHSSGVSPRGKSSPRQLQRLSVTPAHFSPEARVQISSRLKKLAEDVDVTVGSVGGSISKRYSSGCSGGKPFSRGGVILVKGTSQEEQGSDTEAGNEYSSHHVLAINAPSVGSTGHCKTRTRCDCIERKNSGGLSLSNMALLRFTLAPSTAASPCTVTPASVTAVTLTPAVTPDASPFGATIPGAAALCQASLAAPSAHVTARAFMQVDSDSDSIGGFIPTPAGTPCRAAEGAGSKDVAGLPPSPASPTHSPATPSSLPSPASPSSRSSLHRAPLLRIPAFSLLTALASVKSTPAVASSAGASAACAAAAAAAPVPAAGCNPVFASAPVCDASTRVLMVPEDDGFVWRKYGQKLIRACSRPRLEVEGLFDLSLSDAFLGDAPTDFHCSNHTSSSNKIWLPAEQSRGGVSEGSLSEGGLSMTVSDEASEWVSTGDYNEGLLSSHSCSLAMIESLLMSDVEVSNSEYEWNGECQEISQGAEKVVIGENMCGFIGGVAASSVTVTNGALAVGMDALFDSPQPRPHPTHCSQLHCSSPVCRPASPDGNSGLVVGKSEHKRKGSPCGGGASGGEEGALDAWACCKHEAPTSIKQHRTTSGPTSPTQRTAKNSGRAAAFSPHVTPGGSPGVSSGVSSGAAPGSATGVRMVCAQQVVEEPRVVVAVRSDADVVDDGYHWRKYGHKLVGGNTFPRSYYRCTSGNCRVRKQVERSKQDPSMVVTTYEGRHNHSAPGPILCLPQSL